MKLTCVRIALEQFGQKIQNKTIAEAEIRELIAKETFSTQLLYSDYAHDLSDGNYTRSEAIQLFILGLAKIEGMCTEALLNLVLNMIRLLPDNIPEKNFPSEIPPLILSLIGYLYATHNHDVEVVREALLNLSEKINYTQPYIQRKLNFSTSGGGDNLNLLAEQQISYRILTNISFAARSFNQPLSPRLTKAMVPLNTASEPASVQEQIKKLKASIATSVHRQDMINALYVFKAHYSNPATQAHQSVFHPEKITQSTPRTTLAAGKAGVASDLIEKLESFTDMTHIPNVFLDLLRKHGLTTSDGKADPSLFFDGTKILLFSTFQAVQLPEKFENFLCSTIENEATPSEMSPLIPVISHDEENEKTTEDSTLTTSASDITLNPLIAAPALNPSYSNSSSSFFTTTSNETPENKLLNSLECFYQHYSSRINQLHESFRYFGQKDTALKKANVARGLIEFIRQRDTNNSIHSKFEDLLRSNGITSEQFFDGNTKNYLTKENIALLKNAGASASIEL